MAVYTTVILLSPCSAGSSPVSQWLWELQSSLPHDNNSFTQGLVADADSLIESSGLYGQSYIHRYHSLTGELQKRTPLPDELFAEGVAVIGQRLFCLSWRAGKLLILDKDTLQFTGEHHYRSEGWGLAALGGDLLMSDGSSWLTVRDADQFRVQKRIQVTYNGTPLERLNDLTVDDQGVIWANVWKTDWIVAIDAASGQVIGRVDASALRRRENPSHAEYVLNGLAWDSQRNALWVRGKRWQQRYLIRISRTSPVAR